jgi:hypothetical protein
MDQQCKNCDQKERCREVFEKLGNSKAPPVLMKVIQAFLLPLVLFIAALAVMGKILAERPANSFGRDITALAAAAFVVFLYLMILKLWRRKN